MYYKLEWNEENTNHFQRVFQAKDVATLWKAVYYMNLERNDQHRLIMEKLQITILEEYWKIILSLLGHILGTFILI